MAAVADLEEGSVKPGAEGSTGRAGAVATLIPALTQGVVMGVLEVVIATSFAALVFSGSLAIYLPSGIGIALFGAVAVMTIVALLSSFPGTVASVQDSTAAVLALAAAAIAANLDPGDPDIFLTVILAVGMSTIATGVVFLLLGTFRLGDLVRFVPYPVVGGFLAGTGWLLAKGGVGVLTGLEMSLDSAGDLVSSTAVAKWLPGLVFAVVLLVLLRRFDHFLVTPGLVAAGIIVFYTAVMLSGSSVSEAEAGGWLLGPFPDAGLWRPWMLESFGQADWGAVIEQAAGVATMVMVAVLALLLNASGIELVAGRDVDLNRELRAAGAANLVAGFGGGLAGFHSLSLTALAQRSGARSRLVGIVAAGVCLVVLLAGAAPMSLFPRPVLGGLLLFLGLSFLIEWAVDAWAQLPRADYVVVMLILFVIAAFGFLQGVGVGIALAVVLFVVKSSRTDVVKHELSASTARSKVDRSLEEREVLRAGGGAVHVFELQGFLFFGTANRLLERARARAEDEELPSLRYLLVDFRRVIGLDSSAVLSFSKAVQIGAQHGFTLVFTGLRDGVQPQLERGGITESEEVRFFSELDRGLEWCEDRLLEGAGAAGVSEAALLDRLSQELDTVGVEAIGDYLVRIEVAAGHEIIRQGDPAGDVYFLESGLLTAQLVTGAGPPLRLRTMGPGTVVGEMSLYLGGERTASVIAEEPSVIYRLPESAFDLMDKQHPELGAAMHRFFARMLADRLSETLRSMSALRD